MSLAICPGSFDPITLGHIDVIKRAARLFDRVVVVVMVNVDKTPNFTVDERVDFLRRSTKDLQNVSVDKYTGLLADYAVEKQASAVVKGLRAITDFEYEFQMALTNMRLAPGVETVFLPTRIGNMFLSSSMVRQVARYGGDISGFVPACVAEDIAKKLCGKVCIDED